MTQIRDYADRYALVNELHARPFPVLSAPCRAAFVAFKQPVNPAERDRAADRAHLIALLDRFGAAHPQPGATHYSGQIGRHQLKWEDHTEFTTFTLFAEGLAEAPFNAETFAMFPPDWLSEAPGERVTSALIRVEKVEVFDGVPAKVDDWFVPESLAVAQVLDGEGVIASDGVAIDLPAEARIRAFDSGPTRTPGVGNLRTGQHYRSFW